VRHPKLRRQIMARRGGVADENCWQNSARPGAIDHEIYGAIGAIRYAVWQEESQK
jgi:hypothetical protein